MSVVLALVGGAGVFVAVVTLLKIERQTAATEKQATHMVDSERPFLMVETRGNEGTEFWMRNCGKSPAQILFAEPSPQIDFPEWNQKAQDHSMPYPPQYGKYYEAPGAEQINVQWLAPGDARSFASFDRTELELLRPQLKAEISGGQKRIYIYSAIKYRGMFSTKIFESRFCYGWSPTRGTYMAGPYGYNKYT